MNFFNFFYKESKCNFFFFVGGWGAGGEGVGGRLE